MNTPAWAVSPPRPCTCAALPPAFRTAMSAGITLLVLGLGTTLFLLGHPVADVLRLLGGLVLLAASLAWAVITGQRLLPGALGRRGTLEVA